MRRRILTCIRSEVDVLEFKTLGWLTRTQVLSTSGRFSELSAAQEAMIIAKEAEKYTGVVSESRSWSYFL